MGNIWHYLPMIKFKLSSKILEFYIIGIFIHDFDNVPIIKNFSDNSDDNNMMFILYNEMCHYLEKLSNSLT